MLATSSCRRQSKEDKGFEAGEGKFYLLENALFSSGLPGSSASGVQSEQDQTIEDLGDFPVDNLRIFDKDMEFKSKITMDILGQRFCGRTCEDAGLRAFLCSMEDNMRMTTVSTMEKLDQV